MKTKIQSIHFHADKKLEDLILKKVGKLERIFDRITSIEVFLKLDTAGHSINDKVVEIKLNLPRTTLFATAASKKFELGAAQAAESMESQLRKYKERLKG